LEGGPKKEWQKENMRNQLKSISENLESMKKFGQDGQKAIEFIDEYNKFVEKTYKEKSSQLAQKDSQRKEHVDLIKSGKAPIKTLEDAKIYYDAKEDDSIVTKPPLKPDNKYYVVTGTIDGKEGNYYRVKYQSWNDLHYFMFCLTKNISVPNLRVGNTITIVGKFIKTSSYKTVVGDERYMSIFEAVYIE